MAYTAKLKTLLAALLLAAAAVAPAHAASLPKHLAGTWCEGILDDKGATLYGSTLETGSCPVDEVTMIITPSGYRVKTEGYDDFVCRFEQFESHVEDGVPRISFTAKCPEARVKATGSFFFTDKYRKAMDLKWEKLS